MAATQKDWAEAGPVGLFGFALTTMATGLANAGYWGLGPTLAMAIIGGGTTQLIAGIIELKRGNIYGGTVHTGYGWFWIALFVLLFILPTMGKMDITNSDLFGFWLVWVLFTLAMTIPTPKLGRAVTVVLVLLLLAFILLAIDAGLNIPPTSAYTKAMGWEIFIDGLAAWYVGMAIVVNSVYGRKVVPIS